MLLAMIDNYDSFTYNLYQLFAEFGLDIQVFRHDRISLEELEALGPDWLCISPGPKDPAQAGISLAVVRRFAGRLPILGVCLGMQVINEAFGGSTRRAPLPVHGKTCAVSHQGRGIFLGLPSPFSVARYHSLQVILGSQELEPLAWAPDQVLMGLAHRRWPIWGVQFHPESFLTQYGLEMAANFLALAPGFGAALPAVPPGDRFPRWAAQEVQA